MSRPLLTAEAINLLVRSVNILLAANDAPYRVTADDMMTTRRAGYTFLALRETAATADFATTAPPATAGRR